MDESWKHRQKTGRMAESSTTCAEKNPLVITVQA